MKYIIILISLVSMVACLNKNISSQNILVDDIKNITGLYHVTSINSIDVSENNLTIQLDHEKQNIYGFSGCNSFSGSYTLDNDALKIGPLASTRKLCQETINKIEQNMLESLSKIDGMALKGNMLELISNQKTIIIANKTTQKDSTVFKYTAESRGFFLELVVNHSTISVMKDRNSKPISKKCSKEEWDKLIGLLKQIDLDSLSHFKAPTEVRFHDAAAIAKLSIQNNDITYESVTFDHGQPPIKISLLVKELVSLSENID